MTIIHVTPGPDLRVPTGRTEVKWCFNRGCRAHLPHEVVVWRDSKPSYYEPVAVWECSRCGEDHTEFPYG